MKRHSAWSVRFVNASKRGGVVVRMIGGCCCEGEDAGMGVGVGDRQGVTGSREGGVSGISVTSPSVPSVR